jgi:hypothetical protein
MVQSIPTRFPIQALLLLHCFHCSTRSKQPVSLDAYGGGSLSAGHIEVKAGQSANLCKT